MMVGRNLGSKVFDVLNILFFSITALIMILPLWNVLMMSFVSVGEYFQRTLILWPKHFYFDSYKYLFGSKEVPNAFMVTIFITVAGSIYSMIVTTMLSYGLSKKGYPGRNFFLAIITITMFFGGGLIPYFLLIKNLHLINTLAALIVPTAVSVWNFLVIKSFFSQLPAELEESAKIDGASDVTVFFRIALPISKPVLATFLLFYGVGYWNTWYSALLFIHKEELRTLQLVLRQMVVESARSSAMELGSMEKGLSQAGLFFEGIKMATVIVATVPILCVYPFLQKYFTKGMMIGSIKG